METAEVTDLYQASYYLLSGCEILGVECIPAGTGTSCRIAVRGPNLTDLAQAWFDKSAVVNLWTFRNAYTEINTHVQQAKRSFDLSRRYRRETV
jgi:hypothetical protein